MKLIFMGTPAFAVPSLRALAGSRHDIAAVVTNPDRPAGRGRKLSPPPIKTVAAELELELLQPASLKDSEFTEHLRRLAADLFIVVAFSILPRRLLRLPAIGSVNLHPSLLPAYRGAAPIPWALFNGETETGLTTFLLSPRVDAGDILMQRRIQIEEYETAGELEARLRNLGALALVDSIDGLEDGSIQPVPQSGEGISQARKLTKEDGRINWNQPSTQIHNRVRGANPMPGAFSDWIDRKPLKIHRCRPCSAPVAAAPGTILRADEGGLLVASGDGAIELTEVQPPGKPAMDASAFLRGHPLSKGARVGEA